MKLLCQWNAPGKNTRMGSHSLLQGTFATQESNLASLRCRQILYPMSRQGRPLSTVLQSNSVLDYTVRGILQARILEWVAVLFSRGSSQPRNRTQVSRTAGRFFTSWATRKPSFTYIYIDTYTHYFSHSTPWWFISGYWMAFPVLYSRTL